MTVEGEVTRMARAAGKGDRKSWDKLVELVYDDLRVMARTFRSGERKNHTLQATELAHEAFLRLRERDLEVVNDRVHLMSLLGRIMRNILVDHARRKKAKMRSVDRDCDDMLSVVVVDPGHNLDFLSLDLALNDMTSKLPRLTQVVECKFFAGMTTSETAEALDVATTTVERDWVKARTYLMAALDAPVFQPAAGI